MFDILSRAMKETEGVHCPICRRSFQNFMKIPIAFNPEGEHDVMFPGNSVYLLACFECGCVFVPKDLRDDERAKVKSKAEAKIAKKKEWDAIEKRRKEIEAKGVEVEIQSELLCQYCGRPCKNKLGLASHEKACKQNPSNQ